DHAGLRLGHGAAGAPAFRKGDPGNHSDFGSASGLGIRQEPAQACPRTRDGGLMPKLLVSLQNGVKRITFNTPERRNAVDRETSELLLNAVQEAAHDAS